MRRETIDMKITKYEREIVEAIKEGRVHSVSNLDEENKKLVSIVRKQFKDGVACRQLPKESK